MYNLARRNSDVVCFHQSVLLFNLRLDCWKLVATVLCYLSLLSGLGAKGLISLLLGHKHLLWLVLLSLSIVADLTIPYFSFTLGFQLYALLVSHKVLHCHPYCRSIRFVQRRVLEIHMSQNHAIKNSVMLYHWQHRDWWV